MQVVLLFLSLMSIDVLGGEEIAVLPDTIVGDYVGTIIWGKPSKVSQNAIAKVTKGNDQKLVTISFSGGIPAVDESTPQLKNFQFKRVIGSQVEVFESVKVEQSHPGVQLSASMENMNIVNVVIEGVKIEFTGIRKKFK